MPVMGKSGDAMVRPSLFPVVGMMVMKRTNRRRTCRRQMERRKRWNGWESPQYEIHEVTWFTDGLGRCNNIKAHTHVRGVPNV